MLSLLKRYIEKISSKRIYVKHSCKNSSRPNLIVIWAYNERVRHYYFHYAKFAKKVMDNFNHVIVDTSFIKNQNIDIKEIQERYFPRSKSIIIFFPSGSWIGNNNNYLINHENFVKVLDIEDQKNNKQINEMIIPYRINYVLYRYASQETEEFKKMAEAYVKKFFLWPHFTDRSIFFDRSLPKEYDVCFYGNYDELNYPLRNKIYKVLKNGQNKIRVRFVDRKEGIFEERLSALLNKSWLSVACPVGMHDRFVNKYQEISMSGSCILGELPTEYRDEARGNYVRINGDMSETEILSVIIQALEDKDNLSKMAHALKSIYDRKYSVEEGERQFLSFLKEINCNLVQ